MHIAQDSVYIAEIAQLLGFRPITHTGALPLDSWRTSVPQTPFLCPPPCPISKYATEYATEWSASE